MEKLNQRIASAGRLYYILIREFIGKRYVSKEIKITVFYFISMLILTYRRKSTWHLRKII